MHIERIKLLNWQTISRIELSLNKGVNLVYVPNESEKDILIEAIRLSLAENFLEGDQQNTQPTPGSNEVESIMELDIQTSKGTYLQIWKSLPHLSANHTTSKSQAGLPFPIIQCNLEESLEELARAIIQKEQNKADAGRRLELLKIKRAATAALDTNSLSLEKVNRLHTDIMALLDKIHYLESRYPSGVEVDAERLEDLRKQAAKKLAGTSLQQIETALRLVQDDFRAGERRLAALEPRDMPRVEPHHIARQIEITHDIQLDIDRLADLKAQIEAMTRGPLALSTLERFSVIFHPDIPENIQFLIFTCQKDVFARCRHKIHCIDLTFELSHRI